MPTINKMNGPKKPLTQTKEKQVITKADAGTVDASTLVKPQVTKPTSKPTTAVATADEKSLAKAAQSIRIPAFLQNVDMFDTMAGGGVEFSGFCEVQSKNYSVMVHAGLEAGDPYIFFEGTYHKKNPFEFFLLEGKSYRAAMIGKKGKFCFVTDDINTPLSKLAEETGNDYARKAEPFYAVLMLVEHEGKLLPIRGDFKGTKSDAARIPNLAVREAGSVDWGKKSDAHRVTMAYPQPWGRVWNSVTTFFRTSKSTGNDMYIAACKSEPATIAQMQLLIDSFADDDFLARLNAAKESYDKRLATLDRFITDPESETD